MNSIQQCIITMQYYTHGFLKFFYFFFVFGNQMAILCAFKHFSISSFKTVDYLVLAISISLHLSCVTKILVILLPEVLPLNLLH